MLFSTQLYFSRTSPSIAWSCQSIAGPDASCPVRCLRSVTSAQASASFNLTVSGIARARGNLKDNTPAASTSTADASRQALNP